MNELQVVVKQEAGKINWNFEELKTALATEMKKYTALCLMMIQSQMRRKPLHILES